MRKTFNYYCDESTHLQNDGQPYMLISYISSAYNQVKLHQKNIEEIKLPLNYNKKILSIPLNLKKLICYEKYEFINDFNCEENTY